MVNGFKTCSVRLGVIHRGRLHVMCTCGGVHVNARLHFIFAPTLDDRKQKENRENEMFSAPTEQHDHFLQRHALEKRKSARC
jgi:hypothetical protein